VIIVVTHLSWWYGAIFRWFFGTVFLVLAGTATNFCHRHWKNKIARKGVTNPIPMVVLADNAVTLFILVSCVELSEWGVSFILYGCCSWLQCTSNLTYISRVCFDR
jgi:hypothetical protein